MVRLQIKEVAERYGINRYEIGRQARLSEPTMDRAWKPENTAIRLETLDKIAEAITAILAERQIGSVITVHDLIDTGRPEA